MPATSYVLLPNLKKGLCFAIGEGSRIFVACFLHSSAKCLYQTPGRRPPPITSRFVNTVTRGWVGAPNERASFRFHGAVVGFVYRCLSRTQNPADSNKHLTEFFSGRSWPKNGPGNIFFGVYEKFGTFFWKICTHSERNRNLLAGIFEILTFYGNIAFPLSPVLPEFFSPKFGNCFPCFHEKVAITSREVNEARGPHTCRRTCALEEKKNQKQKHEKTNWPHPKHTTKTTAAWRRRPPPDGMQRNTSHALAHTRPLP